MSEALRQTIQRVREKCNPPSHPDGLYFAYEENGDAAKDLIAIADACEKRIRLLAEVAAMEPLVAVDDRRGVGFECFFCNEIASAFEGFPHAPNCLHLRIKEATK